MIEDSYKQYKADFKHIFKEAKLSPYPRIKSAAQTAIAYEAFKAGHNAKAIKWAERAKQTLKEAGMLEVAYLEELQKNALKV